MNTKNMIWIASLFIALMIALIFATFNQPGVSAQNLGTASIPLQITATPTADITSEIGSTDGIFIMGIVIILITVFPVLLYRKKN